MIAFDSGYNDVRFLRILFSNNRNCLKENAIMFNEKHRRETTGGPTNEPQLDLCHSENDVVERSVFYTKYLSILLRH